VAKIMIIRHAEKPLDGGIERAVSLDGFHAKHELTVRGWQRAAALVGFFAPVHPMPEGHPIAPPQTIFASAANIASPSLRAQRTIEPLALKLGVTVVTDHAEFEETELAAAALAAASPALIVWHHHAIPALARRITASAIDIPPIWPDDRFDLVWVLDRAEPGGAWKFVQVAQQLFAQDRDEFA